jgi:transposase
MTLRKTHLGGGKLFVDYAGDTVPVIVDRLTVEVREAQIFVTVMGGTTRYTATLSLSPSARITFSTVANSGFPSGDRAL